MASFTLTPTNIEDYNWILKNPITGEWTIPILNFDPTVLNPYITDADLVNADVEYQRRTVDYFYAKLTEKWLYKPSFYKPLLKFFTIDKSTPKGTVTLVHNLEKVSKNTDKDTNADDYMYILKYLEKYIIKRRFVEKSLRSYIRVTCTKWYDLYTIGSEVRDLFRHKLKKLLINMIHNSDESKQK